jgi:hydrophobic/amphiphilic exporter-1 (mainly G- bacteria), HAE1 family
LFTTPVIYLFLDRLSNAFAGWGRSRTADHERDDAAHSSVKEAAE